MNGIIPQAFSDDVNLYPMGNGGVYGTANGAQGGREGSIHSQQEKGWARGFFGGVTAGKEKEANAELMRMIGASPLVHATRELSSH